MAANSLVPTRFIILSDTHNFEFSDKSSQPLQLPTPKADVLLHCGDLTEVGGVSSFQKAINMIASFDAELKLVIAGNHDLELDKTFWEARRGDESGRENPEAHEMAVKAMIGPLAVDAGVIFLNEGTHSFTLKNGATFSIYASPYTPVFCDWAFAYEHHEDRFNEPHQTAKGTTSIATNPILDHTDIVMTHGPPKGILDWSAQGNVGCPNLLKAIQRVRPKMHCFGHVHEGYGVEVINWNKPAPDPKPLRKNEAIHRFFEEDPIDNPYPDPFEWQNVASGEGTLAVNAAIMTANNKPENAPWIIDLDLPRAKQCRQGSRLQK
ncbi:MAG: hypothetical protein Q9182_005875 [Xanthomendoza sp. 2 TL-2023]